MTITSGTVPADSGKLSMPFKKNTQWQYAVQSEESLPAKHQASNEPWTTSIAESHISSELSVAVILGFPSDLVWAEPDQKKNLSIITLRQDGLWFNKHTNSDSPISLIESVLAGQQLGEHVLKPNPQIGDHIPEGGGSRYGWTVESEITFKGLPGWRLLFRTNPDHQYLDFVPTIGFSRFEYVHHGTVQNVTAELQSFHIP
jgi:hypothetical protein